MRRISVWGIIASSDLSLDRLIDRTLATKVRQSLNIRMRDMTSTTTLRGFIAGNLMDEGGKDWIFPF